MQAVAEKKEEKKESMLSKKTAVDINQLP